MIVCKYIIEDSRNIKTIFFNNNIDSPDLIITSPPYFNLKNYGNFHNQIGYGQSYEEYLNDVVKIFQECYDLASENTTFWLVVDTLKINGAIRTLPFDIHQGMTSKYKETWKLKEIIIWNKKKNIPWNSKGNFKNIFEYIFFYTKGKKYKFNMEKIRKIDNLKKWYIKYPERYNPNGVGSTNLWDFTTAIRGWGYSRLNHICPFPFPLVEKILSIASEKGDLVFDPFCGSGSVLAMSKVMERNSIGIDLNSNYKEKFLNEVLEGAQKYFKKRKEEIFKSSDKYSEFKINNKKLRKNKLGALISDKIATLLKNKKIIFIVQDNNVRNNEIEIYALSSKNNVNLKLNEIYEDEEIKEIERKFKIKFKIATKDINEFLSLFSKSSFYKYKLSEFYNYEKSISSENILKEEKLDNHFYSNIKIKINEE